MTPVIVCGADGSDESLAAAEVAGRLAKRLRGRLVVGHVLKRARALPYGHHEYVDPGSHRTGREAKHLFERVAARAPEAEIDRRVVHGRPAEALAGLAVNEDALMSVVGSRGRGPAKAALFGSTSLNLVSKTRRPVAIVPRAGADGDPPDREAGAIVCGVDGSQPGLAAAVVASELAGALHAELVLLHVYEPFPAASTPAAPGAPPPAAADHERLKQRQRRAAESVLEAVAHGIGARQPTRTVAQAGFAVSELAGAAADYAADLIVVGTHGRSGVAAALMGSTSAHIAAAARTPVLLVPEGSHQRFKEQLSSLSTTDSPRQPQAKSAREPQRRSP